MPRKAAELVDVSDTAHDAGFHILANEPAFLEYQVTRTDGTRSLPVYLTQALWLQIGGPHGPGFLSDLHHILYHAHLAAYNAMVLQNAWRTGFQVTFGQTALSLWMILGPPRSNGFAIGLGAGDFW
jgi:hypothetical protein